MQSDIDRIMEGSIDFSKRNEALLTIPKRLSNFNFGYVRFKSSDSFHPSRISIEIGRSADDFLEFLPCLSSTDCI